MRAHAPNPLPQAGWEPSLKKEWRREWEREQGALAMQREVETITSINAKIDRMRKKEEAARLLEEQRRDPTREELDEEARAEREFDEWLASIQPSPEMQKLLPGYVDPDAVEEKPGPRVRTVKDEGWG